jgi:putative phosphoesterase
MLLAVFSDSHGAAARLCEAVHRCRPDAAVFLGDGVRDAETLARRFPELPLRILRGNCDWAAVDCEDSALFELGGVRIFAAHGHNHAVKYGLDGFATSVLCSGAALGLYGHTHRAQIRTLDGLTLLNPGSIGNMSRPTYGEIRINNGKFQCRIVDFSAETEQGSPTQEQETER